MHLKNSRAALVVAASLAVAGLAIGGCAKDDLPSRTPAILTDLEAARLAELHLDDTAAEAGPRDVVTIDTSYGGKGYIVGFQSFFDESQRPPKLSRLVMVDHDGDVRELTFKD